MQDPLIIVQARIGGSRFPGKMLAPLCGQPVILWTLQRIRRLSLPYRLVVATPPGQENDVLVDLCRRHGFEAFAPARPEIDVLARYQNVADFFQADTIVRVTGDCCLIDAAVIEGCLQRYYGGRSYHDYDHVGIAAEWMDGMDCEVFSRHALELAHTEATDPVDLEHVTSFLWRQPQRFRCGTYPCPMDLTAYQTSIDTPQDLLLAQGLLFWCLEHYGFGFTWRDVWMACEMQPHLKYLMLQRPPRNQSYVAQVGGATWERIRYEHS